jgi:glycosyltransferase involved in cell wall biosynthesis
MVAASFRHGITTLTRGEAVNGSEVSSGPVRVCIVYDCLYPFTVGGAERWYRSLAEALARDGHDVTYLTMRQWSGASAPDVPGVRVLAMCPSVALYTQRGRRRLWPPIRFGIGVLAHLLRRGRRYDVVHTASFPYFSVLAAGAARPLHRYRLAVDWLEVWTRDYWREYLGRLGGPVGAGVQGLCLAVPQHAFCISALVERRLREEGFNGEVTRLAGLRPAPAPDEVRARPAEPVLVFAGRHIPEKRVPALIPAFLAARESIPGLRCEIYGDGPERAEVLRLIERHGLSDEVIAPGFVEEARVAEAIASALCLVLPSRREGFGIVVAEAAAHGTPVVLVAGEDNAALELVEEGVNGTIAPSAAADDLADAILRVHARGHALRESAADWYRQNGERFSLERSLETVGRFYGSTQ